jgi:xanthine dehydrogenase iron-sulfur cluster and FAD-binding subunit A
MAAARTVNFTLNGQPVTADVKPHHNLVELLQSQFALTGARETCGQGLCGCCTVIVDGRAVSSCLYLASFVDGADVVTVEGLDTPSKLSPVQEAFTRAGGVHRDERVPVRLLYARVRPDDDPAARRAPRPRRPPDPTLPVGQPVSLRRLSADHGSGEARRAKAQKRGNRLDVYFR